MPWRYVVTHRRTETADTATQWLRPLTSALPRPASGQFMMLTAFGVGEAPISVSGVGADETLTHTIRAIGPVTKRLVDLEAGSVVGVRGPFGVGWDVPADGRHDLLFVAGGIGLAPLRPGIRNALASAGPTARVIVLVGAKTPAGVLFSDDLAAWAQHDGVQVRVTVDRPDDKWSGHVGLITTLLPGIEFDPWRTIAFVCGPEVMMHAVAEDLLRRGISGGDIRMSLERNMQCGIGLCGHCQLGPLLICRDGPVVTYDDAASLLVTKEL